MKNLCSGRVKTLQHNNIQENTIALNYLQLLSLEIPTTQFKNYIPEK